MAINKFTNDVDKPFHSNAYAEAAHSGSLGATSSQSFQQRYDIDQNRRSISRYRDSHVAYGSRSETQQRRDYHTDPVRRPQFGPMSRPRQNAMSTPKPLRTSFNEPPSRIYNPYG